MCEVFEHRRIPEKIDKNQESEVKIHLILKVLSFISDKNICFSLSWKVNFRMFELSAYKIYQTHDTKINSLNNKIRILKY